MSTTEIEGIFWSDSAEEILETEENPETGFTDLEYLAAKLDRMASSRDEREDSEAYNTEYLDTRHALIKSAAEKYDEDVAENLLEAGRVDTEIAAHYARSLERGVN